MTKYRIVEKQKRRVFTDWHPMFRDWGKRNYPDITFPPSNNDKWNNVEFKKIFDEYWEAGGHALLHPYRITDYKSTIYYVVQQRKYFRWYDTDIKDEKLDYLWSKIGILIRDNNARIMQRTHFKVMDTFELEMDLFDKDSCL